jgi:hypothetical protein
VQQQRVRSRTQCRPLIAVANAHEPESTFDTGGVSWPNEDTDDTDELDDCRRRLLATRSRRLI